MKRLWLYDTPDDRSLSILRVQLDSTWPYNSACGDQIVVDIKKNAAQ